MSIVYLCLGSNLGDRFSLIQQAVSLFNLSETTDVIRSSAVYETEPWGLKEQNWFLNVVLEIKTSLSPRDLLKKCQEIETVLGLDRSKKIQWGERLIDIDILFYDKEIVGTEELVIPHKYLHKRAFVLVPLLELIPDFVHPVFNKTITELYDNLEDVENVFLYGTKPNEFKM